MTEMNLSHHFLIAMPAMADPQFAGTVSYILQHDEQGAMGVIINRISPYQLAEICQSAQISPVDSLKGEHSVHHGGPVSAEQGFVLHRYYFCCRRYNEIPTSSNPAWGRFGRALWTWRPGLGQKRVMNLAQKGASVLCLCTKVAVGRR